MIRPGAPQVGARAAPTQPCEGIALFGRMFGDKDRPVIRPFAPVWSRQRHQSIHPVRLNHVFRFNVSTAFVYSPFGMNRSFSRWKI